MWIPDGPALRAARTAAGMSRDDLARRAGVSERTVRRAESGEVVREALLRLVVQALGGKLEQLAASAKAVGGAGRTPERLAKLVTHEAERSGGARDERFLGAAVLKALYTTPLAYHGDRLLIADAEVFAGEAGDLAEAKALGVARGLVGRFGVRTRGGRGDLEVTVHSADAASARALHARLHAAPAPLHVRVHAVSDEQPFVFLGSPRLHDWTLVAVPVAPDVGAEDNRLAHAAAAKPRSKRKG